MSLRYYELTIPTKDEIVVIRRLLNRAGYHGFILPFLLLFCIYLFRKTTELWSHYHQRKGLLRPPIVRGLPRYSITQKVFRRIHWILTTTFYAEYGPLYIQLLGTIYAFGLLYIVVAPTTTTTTKSYLHLTKALGHVAVSQLPIHYLLAVKTPSSPITWITGLTHERLNAVHRLLGQLIILMMATHASLYLSFFVAKGVLWKRIGHWDVRIGLMAFAAVSVLDMMALPVVRRKWYHAGFYRTHVYLSAVLVVLLWLHVSYTRSYVAAAGFLWVLNGTLRGLGGRLGWNDPVVVTCKAAGEGIIQVKAQFEGDNSHTRQRWADNWCVGMHGYLNQDGIGPRAPFTVVDMEKDEIGSQALSVRLVVRDLGGPTTGLLSRLAKSEKSIKLSLEGPYGEAKEYMPKLLDTQNDPGGVLIVAGGIGSTYALPIYIALLNARRLTPRRLKFVWLVREVSDVNWGIDLLKEVGHSVNVDILVTGTTQSKEDYQQHDIDGLDIHFVARSPDMMRQWTTPFLGRLPDRKSDESQKTSVLVCGPRRLSEQLRRVVGHHVMQYGADVAWYEEQFGFGGS